MLPSRMPFLKTLRYDMFAMPYEVTSINLFRPVFGFCGKVIAEPKGLIKVTKVQEVIACPRKRLRVLCVILVKRS
jgi:hypothetical protein